MGNIGQVVQRLDLKPLNLTEAPPEPAPVPEIAQPEPVPAR